MAVFMGVVGTVLGDSSSRGCAKDDSQHPLASFVVWEANRGGEICFLLSFVAGFVRPPRRHQNESFPFVVLATNEQPNGQAEA